MKKPIQIIVLVSLFFALMGCQSNIKAAPPDFAAFLNYCGAEDFCYQYFMSPNGKYIINFDVPYAEMGSSMDFTVKSIKAIKIIDGYGNEIRYEFPEGFETIYYRLNWSPTENAFYIYGKDELLLFSIKESGKGVSMARFLYDQSRLYLSVGNRSISIYINGFGYNEFCYPESSGCDDYEFFWTPDGKLVNPRKSGMYYDIYHSDGEIETILLEINPKPEIAYKYITTVNGNAYFYKLVDYRYNNEATILEFEQICLSKSRFENLAGVEDIFCMDGRDVLEVITVVEAEKTLFAEIIFYNTDAGELKHAIYSYDQRKNEEAQLIKEYPMENAVVYQSYPMLREVSGEVFVSNYHEKTAEAIDPKTNQIVPLLIGGRTPQNMIHDGSPWLRIVLYEIGRGSYDVGFYDASSKKLLLFKDLFPQTWDQDGDGYSDLYFISLGWYESAEQYAYVLINNYDDTAHVEYINPGEYFAQMDD